MEIGVMINRLADGITSNGTIAAIMDNPLYTALMLTIVIMIIVVFSGFGTGERGAVPYVRTSFYITCAIVASLFIYHRRYKQQSDKNKRIETIGQALARPSTIAHPDSVPIIQPIYMSAPN